VKEKLSNQFLCGVNDVFFFGFLIVVIIFLLLC
jgi:hypothetical protein